MLRSLVVTLLGGLLIFGGLAWVFYRDDHAVRVKPVQAQELVQALTNARRELGPAAPIPGSVPPGWTVTSARYAPFGPGSAAAGPSLLHVGYVTTAGHYVDLEVGAEAAAVTAALDPFDGAHPVQTGQLVSGLAQSRADDATLSLRGAAAPYVGLTGTKDPAELSLLASVLRPLAGVG
jgi:hypothetical protein